MHACHCERCRRTSGGVSLSVDCGDTVEVEGPLATYDSSDWAERQFCSACGSNLFWRLKAGGMVMVSVQAFCGRKDDDEADELQRQGGHRDRFGGQSGARQRFAQQGYGEVVGPVGADGEFNAA
nr:GFA family protein [Brevundimonas diminuta]